MGVTTTFNKQIQSSGAEIKAQLLDLIGGWTREKLLDHYGGSLRGQNLAKRNLNGVDLSGLDMRDADCYNTNFTNTNLRAADLINADLAGAILINADLHGAKLRDTNLFRADPTDADLRNTVGLKQEQIDQAYTSVTTQLPTHLQTGQNDSSGHEGQQFVLNEDPYEFVFSEDGPK